MPTKRIRNNFNNFKCYLLVLKLKTLILIYYNRSYKHKHKLNYNQVVKEKYVQSQRKRSNRYLLNTQWELGTLLLIYLLILINPTASSKLQQLLPLTEPSRQIGARVKRKRRRLRKMINKSNSRFNYKC